MFISSGEETMQMPTVRAPARHIVLVRVGVFCVLVAQAGFALDARAEFFKTSQQTLPTQFDAAHENITFDGAHWYISAGLTGRFITYDPDFTSPRFTPLAGFTDTRGMTHDPATGHLFVGDWQSGAVREITTGGATVSQFTGGFSLEGLTFDPRDNTLWLSYFTGAVEHRTRSGGVLSSFNGAPGRAWAGIALDPASNTLLLMDNDDTVYEYSFAGAELGAPLPGDQIDGNGLGLFYVPTLGRLYTTSQEGFLTIFDDPARVPEPGGILLLGGAGVLLGLRRPRRRRA
jgi:hypothetical protein